MIVLVRHGRTEANARGVLLGRSDPTLDDEGRRQAALLAGGLGGLDVVRVVSSPLVRCRSTAEILVDQLATGRSAAAAEPKAPGLDVEVDERWVELDYGALEGVPLGEVPPGSWASWRADVAWAPEGGESLGALGTRVRAACADLAECAAGADVVVVSHVSPIKAAVAWALGVGDEIAWRMWLAPASITRLGVSAGVPTLRSFNELSHLG